MADNFDLYVARRKPNVAKRGRPVHPWDVPPNNAVDDSGVDDGASSGEDALSDAVSDQAHSASVNEESASYVDNAVDAGDGASDTVVSVADDGQIAASSVSAPEEVSDDSSSGGSVKSRVPASVSMTKGKRAGTVRRSSKSADRPAIPAVKPGSGRAETVSKSDELSNSINIHSNFCKLDNAVSDHLFPRLSPSAQSVYLRLYRQSFGWNRNWAAESLPKLSKGCNLSLQTIRKAIRELEGLGAIRKEFSDYHKATVYRVYLPSEIGITVHGGAGNARAIPGGAVSDTQETGGQYVGGLVSESPSSAAQSPDTGSSDTPGVKNFDPLRTDTGGQDIVTQSLYFAGTSIYSLLESGGPLPKNIRTYITDIHLRESVSIIDEFYDSIGFSVVSRAVYRKSMVDYFDLIKSGFTSDDIRYAVRWTFRNSRSRPESFSLIKHTMHLAMDDMIRDLKEISGEADMAKQKRAALKKTAGEGGGDGRRNVTNDDLKTWTAVIDRLREELNDRSFRAFIEPLRLLSVENGEVAIAAPQDSLSWIVDHYRDVIETGYRSVADADVAVTIEGAG